MDIREFYAFISYKRGGNDEVWAKSLYHHLISWHIPIEIPDNLRLNNKERIDPIFKDKDNLSGNGGNLDDKLKESLKNSRTLILILSRRMYEAEKKKMESCETPYIFEEVKYFVEELEHPTDDVIIVYIDNEEYDSQILPPSLQVRQNNINVVNINDYLKEKNYKKHTAAKVAAGIFHSDKDVFWRYHERILKEQRKRNLVVLFSIVLILGVIFGGFYFSAMQSTKTAEAFRLIELSKQAYNKGDVQAAKILSIEAYDKKPSLEEVQENLWKYDIDDYNKPFATIPSGVVISNSGKEIMYLEDNYLVIKNSYTLEDIERININMQSLVSRVVYSQDDSKIAIVRYDSIKIYDRNMKDFIYTENSSWLTRDMEPWYDNLTFCNNDNNFLIYYRSDSRIMNFDIANDKISIFNTLDSAPNHLYVVNNEVFVELEDSLGFGLYQYDYVNNAIDTIIRYELSGQTLRDYAINPQTKQSVLVSQDTIYCVNRNKTIFFKTAFEDYIRHTPFNAIGTNIICYDKKNIFVCDTLGLVWSIYKQDIKDIQWASDSTFLCITENDISCFDVKSRSETKYNINCSRDIEHVRHYYYLDDSLFIVSPLYYPTNYSSYTSGYTEIAHLSILRSKERCFYSPNGEYYLRINDPHVWWNEEVNITCGMKGSDSLLWDMKSNYQDQVIMSNDKIVKYNTDGINIIDIQTGAIINAIDGKVVSSSDRQSKPRLQNDNIILYTNNDSLYLQNIIDNKKVALGRVLGEDRYKLDCDSKNGIYAISSYDTLYILNLEDLSIIKTIEINNNKYGIKGLQVSLDGRYVVCTQTSMDLGNINIYDLKQNQVFSYEYSNYIFYNFVITNQNKMVFTDHHAGNIYIYNLDARQFESQINAGFMPTNIIDLSENEILLTDYDNNNYILRKKNWSIEGSYKHKGRVRLYDGVYMRIGNKLINRETGEIIRTVNETIKYITDSVIIYDTSDPNLINEELVPMEDVKQFRDRLKAQVGNRQLSEWEIRRFAKEE